MIEKANPEKKVKLKPLILKFFSSTYLHVALIFCLTLLATYISVTNTAYIKNNPCFSDVLLTDPIRNTDFVYKINCDSGEFIKSGRDFPGYFKESSVRVSRPGYPFLLMTVSKVIPQGKISSVKYDILVSTALNFLMGLGAAIILYYLTLEFFDKKAALLATFLLILSSHYRVFLAQSHTEIAGNFVVICSLLLLYLYSRKKSLIRLITLSITFGVLMLIKLIFALPFLFGFLAIRYRKIKEYIIFLFISILPMIGWFIYVKNILHSDFSTLETSLYGQGTWFIPYLSNVAKWPFLVWSFILSSGYTMFDVFKVFYFVLPALAIYGLVRSNIKGRYFFFFAYIVSFVLMFYAMLWGAPRLAFGLFPVILPFAAFGLLEGLKKISAKDRKLLLVGAVIGILFLSAIFYLYTLNTYLIIKSFDYDNIRKAVGLGIILGK